MRQFDAYRKTTVDTSDNVRLVSLLFDGAVNFLKVARGKMEQHDIAGKGIYLGQGHRDRGRAEQLPEHGTRGGRSPGTSAGSTISSWTVS